MRRSEISPCRHLRPSTRTRWVAALTSAVCVVIATAMSTTTAYATGAAENDGLQGTPVSYHALRKGESLHLGDRLVSRSGRYSLQLDPGPGDVLVTERASWLAGERQLSVDLPGVWGEPVEMRLLGTDLEFLDEDGDVVSALWERSAFEAVELSDDRELSLTYGALTVRRLGTGLVGGLERGQVLLPGDTTPTTWSRLTMQRDGNLVQYTGTTATWSSGTAGHPGAGAVLQPDGNLVVYSSTEAGLRPLWSSGTSSQAGLVEGEIVEGRFMLVNHTPDGRRQPVWGSRWADAWLRPGEILDTGERRTSAGGRCVLVMQVDENLVQYCDGRPVFATGVPASSRTSSPGDTTSSVAVMQGDGNLVIYQQTRNSRGTLVSSVPRWSTGTWSLPGSTTVVQADGNLVVVRPDGRPVWSTRTGLIFRNR